MAHSESELILHVGLPKTGTTAIQRYMFNNRAELAAKGVYWAETYSNDVNTVNCWAHHVYSHKWGGWMDESCFVIPPDEAWQKLANIISKTPGRYIVSSERFADLLPLSDCNDILGFIRDLVHPAKVTLIGYVRRQDALLESHLKELIKGNQLHISLAEYFSDLMRHASFVYFDQGFPNAAEILGKENVIPRVYDRNTLTRGDVISDFLNTCQIPEVSDPKSEKTLANPSLNTLCGKIMMDERIANKFSHDSPTRTKIITALSQERFEHTNKFSCLDEILRREIMQKFEKSNIDFANAFLSDAEFRALTYDSKNEAPALSQDDPILTTDDLVELLVALDIEPP